MSSYANSGHSSTALRTGRLTRRGRSPGVKGIDIATALPTTPSACGALLTESPKSISRTLGALQTALGSPEWKRGSCGRAQLRGPQWHYRLCIGYSRLELRPCVA